MNRTKDVGVFLVTITIAVLLATAPFLPHEGRMVTIHHTLSGMFAGCLSLLLLTEARRLAKLLSRDWAKYKAWKQRA